MVILIINFIFLFLCKICLTSVDFDCDEKFYYDSLNYSCKECEGYKYLNVCYSSSNEVSIYDFQPIIISCENDDDIFTELDGNGRLLDIPQCVSKNINYSDVNPKYTITISPNPLPIDTTSEMSNTIFYYEEHILSYYNYSCLNGSYDRACDYSANLCALSLYNARNPFCNIISDLNNKLNNKNISDTFKKNNENYITFIKPEDELNQFNIETQIGLDENNFINKMDLYLAK